METIKEIIQKNGGVASMARAMNVSVTSISKWISKEHVPVDRLVDFERITGCKRDQLYPDLFVGYTSKSSVVEQIISSKNDVFYILASQIICKYNSGNIDSDKAKQLICGLYLISDLIGGSEFLKSTLIMWSEMIVNNVEIKPIDLSLVSERGEIDHFVINQTFTQENRVS